MDPPPLPRRCRPSNAPRIHAPGAIWPILAVLAVVALLSLPTLTGSALETAGGTVGPTAAAAADSGCPPVNLPTPICHVFVIFMENQNESWVMRHAPFQEYLAKTYAFAPDYYSVIHYSYPNYVAATSGTETNYLNLHNEKNVVDLIKKAPGNLTWMAYFEDMPHPCDNTTAAGYRVAHNPFVFYTDIRDNQSYCQARDVNFTSYYASAKAGTLPNYAFFGPNSTHSCWKPGSGERLCDAWLRTFVSPMINSTEFNHTVIFITYDEGLETDYSGINGSSGGGHVYTVAVSPYACHGYSSTTQYNHYNLLTTTEWLLGLGRTGTNDSWTTHPPMKDLFCFGNSTGGAGGPSPPQGAGPLADSPSVPVAQAVVRSRVGLRG
jgi:hypothetical protein